MQEIVAVIPARGGSKSIPRKNVRELLGKPLLGWTVEAACQSGVFTRIILSTDDEDAAHLGKSFGAEAPFLRPAELAQDATPTVLVVEHAVEWLRNGEGWVPEFTMVLEPTSPGRRPFHIREAAALLKSSDADSVASVSEVPHHYVPTKVLNLDADGTIEGVQGTHLRDMIHRRQDLPTCYALNGLIFSCKTELILADPPSLWGDKVVAYVVDPRYSLDIDRPEDWAPAETRLMEILKEEEDK